MPAWASAAAIAVLGVAALTGLTFAPPERPGLVAALVPPWQDSGFGRATGLGLAVVDLHWGGHVLIVDTGGDRRVLARLRAQGWWLVDATGARGCGPVLKRTRNDFDG